MGGIEFYGYETEIWCKHSDGRNEIFDETKTDIIQPILEKIRDCYPGAYKALSEYYGKSSSNPMYFQYLMVRRFISCNFSMLDATTVDMEDICSDGKMNFEKVQCPIRFECPLNGIVCNPVFCSALTATERRVGVLWHDGRTKEEIATELFMSPETVNNHIRHIYFKLGVHDKSEFVKYVLKNRIFDNQLKQ